MASNKFPASPALEMPTEHGILPQCGSIAEDREHEIQLLRAKEPWADPERANRRKTEDEIARESYRVVTLMDLAGHEKYLKTT